MTARSQAGQDDLDLLVDLAVQRILMSDEVAAIKFRSGDPVEDRRREQQVLAEAGRRAARLGLDQDVAIRFMQSQIHASKILQRGLLARWQSHPEQAPASTLNLESIRARLEQLDRLLLEQLRRVWAAYPLASLCRGLREVHTRAAAGHDLDLLHRRALAATADWACSAG